MLLSKEELLEKIEKHHGVYLNEISDESLEEADLFPWVAVLPKNFKSKVRYLGNILAQMCLKHETKDDMLRLELRSIATALSYLLNSVSFDDDEYKKFDREEIDRKLQRTNK